MATIPAKKNDGYYSIKKWLGVNENADGDTNLKMGEASTMTNFKITNDASLQKRPGTRSVATLTSSYVLNTASATTTVLTENTSTSATFTAYPSYSISSGGVISLSGTAVTVNYANIASYANYYTQYTGGFYKLGSCAYTPPTGTAVTGGYITDGATEYLAFSVTNGIPYTVYSDVTVSGTTASLSGTSASIDMTTYASAIGTYCTCYNPSVTSVLHITRLEMKQNQGVFYVDFYGYPVVVSTNSTYAWNFYALSVSSNSSDVQVRGIWSGRVGSNEVICAACNGQLWALSVTGGVWSKSAIGAVDTTGPVHMFGFGNKLYIMDGSEYRYWDGSTYAAVTGYRPLVSVSVPPTGGGTSLQRINMLNGQRRVWFSPASSATAFQLPEKSLASIDYVKNLTTGATYTLTTDYTVNTTTGIVTFTTAPATGTNTVEVGYTVSTTLRSSITGMLLSETYNGVNDNRVFIYGDGTNKTYYSDLDYNGNATAEYFPDLNVASIGDANTPIKSMVRHYDRLLAFKTDSAYSLAYDTITLTDGTVTAGFYVTTVNKMIGSAGYGQAIVVENHPRTLDGRSIYQWTATTSSGNITSDQRNAQRISQKVETTLFEIDFENAVCFYDKINHEYFIVEDGVAVVQNTENGTWYIYRDFPAVCMIVYKDELYFGTAGGHIRHVSRDYMSDDGAAITCYWESGSMDFGAAFARKYSDTLWVVLKPEANADLYVTVQTDKMSDYEDEEIVADNTSEVSTGYFSFLNLDFAHFTFNINDKPKTQRRRLKVKNFAWYKLIFSTVSSNTTATVLNASIRVRQTGIVR